MNLKETWTGIDIVRQQEIKKSLARSSFRALLGVWAIGLIAVPAYAFGRVIESKLVASAGEETARALRQYFVDLYVTRYSLVMILMVSGGLLTEAFLREKLEKTLEALLATSLTARQIWIGKCLALFQIGYLFALGVCVAYLAVLSIMMDRPALPGLWAAATVLVGVPLLGFALFCLAGMFELMTSGSRLLYLVLFGVGFLLLWTTFRGQVGALPHLGPGVFATYIGAAAALGAIVLALLPRLTKERVILS